jgi:hypothetical protein
VKNFIYTCIVPGLFFCFTLLHLPCSAQKKYDIAGVVKDSATKELMPFVGISILDSVQNIVVNLESDADGKFKTNLPNGRYTLLTQWVGYKNKSMPFKVTGKNMDNLEVLISEDKAGITLSEIVIRAKENPAYRIIRLANENRKKNNRLVPYMQFTAYNKLSAQLDGLDKKFFEQRLIKPAKQKLLNVLADSTFTDTSRTSMVVFIRESVTDNYAKAPNMRKEILKASRSSGSFDQETMNFLSLANLDLNFYENYVTILDKSFMSPIADGCFAFCVYEQLDTIIHAPGDSTYRIKVYAKTPRDLVFHGFIEINSKNWALTKLDLTVPDKANINFIEKLNTKQEFEYVNGYYVPKRFESSMGIRQKYKGYGVSAKTVSYFSEYKFDNPKPNSFFDGELFALDENAKNISENDTTFWGKYRTDTLSKKEKLGFGLIDTLATLNFVQVYIKTYKFLSSGRIRLGKYFAIGPFYTIASMNALEGVRVRLGIKTTEKVKKLFVYTYGAYGFKDQQWKYQGLADYEFSTQPWLLLGYSHTRDIETPGIQGFTAAQTNILAPFFRRTDLLGLNYYTENKIYFKTRPANGIELTLNALTKSFEPSYSFEYQYTENGSTELRKTYFNAEAQLDARLSFKEKFIGKGRDRVVIANKYPVIYTNVSVGLRNIWGSDFEYQKASITITQRLRTPPFGFIRYYASSGKVFGTVPFPLLHVLKGNVTFIHISDGFNLMNINEFVADRYSMLIMEHHLDGIIMNRIPVLKWLKLREFWTLHVAEGSLTPANKAMTVTSLRPLQAPNGFYVEAGCGIENILKVLRIDFVWRLTNRIPNKANFGVQIQAAVSF